MSSEGWKHNPTSPEVGKEPVSVPEEQETRLPETPPDTTEQDTQQLMSVRERLGLTRRGAIIGSMAAISAASMPAFEAEATERVPSGIEGRDSYNEGRARLRELARTRTQEDAYLFIRDASGRTRWDNIEGFTSNDLQTAGGIFVMNDRRFVERMQTLVRQGSEVEMSHTHPTPMLAREAGVDSETPGIRRVPPSSIDILGMFGAEYGLTDAERERLAFSAVTEEGTWTYESAQGAPIAAAMHAGEPSLTLLSGPYARHASAAARVLRDLFRSTERAAGVPLERMARPLLRSIENGEYPLYLRTNPRELALHAQMFRGYASDTEIPEGARIYFREIASAYDATDALLRSNDPDGYGLNELSSVDPQLGDAGTNFASYREFWQRRGVSLRFTPNE